MLNKAIFCTVRVFSHGMKTLCDHIFEDLYVETVLGPFRNETGLYVVFISMGVGEFSLASRLKMWYHTVIMSRAR